MPRLDLVLRAARAVVGGVERPAAVGVRDGLVELVGDRALSVDADREVLLPDHAVLLPGLVDSHVHLQDPGHPEWEDFGSGTRAAALGRITTLVDMPLDCDPVTVHAGALEAKRRAAAGRCYVDVGFWGGLTRDNAAAVPGLVQAGVLGLKCYLVDPGLPDFPPVSAAGLAQGLRLLAGTGLPLLVHAEDPEVLRRNASAAGRSYAAFVAARPAQAEQVAVGTVVEAVRATGGRAHVVHVSTAAAADLVARAARAGLPVSAETCPHYLALVADQVPDGGTVFAVTPPIRDAGNREQLWQRLRDGSLSMVVSDHSPSGDRSRCEDFDAAAPGVVSLQLALAVTWTAAAARGFGPADLAGWMSAAPSRLAGLAGKGSIAPGKDADFCVFAPDRELLVEPGSLAHRVPATPYDGHRLRGAVLSTWLAGRPVDLTAPPRGRLLRRTAESRAAEREWRS